MSNNTFEVRAEWDSEANVWYVSKTNVPGLVAEGETPEELYEKLVVLVPELVDLNRHLIDDAHARNSEFQLSWWKKETVKLPQLTTATG